MTAFKTTMYAIFTAAALFPAAATADEMALTFENQGVTISGEFAGFSDNAYILVTTVGTLHVPVNLATCEGKDCVTLTTASANN